MALYFFNMTTRGRKLLDSVGKHLPSLSDAHAHALQLIAKTMKYVDTPHHERWMIEICCPSDGARLVVLFPVQHHLDVSSTSFTQYRQWQEFNF